MFCWLAPSGEHVYYPHSKNDFYIHIAYNDAEGKLIEDAQVRLRFLELKPRGISTAKYDSQLKKYVFVWKNFMEWDPGHKRGTYTVEITAESPGYETLITTREFTLK